MDKRMFSTPLMGSRAEMFLSQQSVASIENQHIQKELQHYKKQNILLKKQLQQLKSINNQQKKELSMYKSFANTNFSNKQEQNQQMIQLFQLQQNKILHLQTQLQILKNQSLKSMPKNSTQNQYAIKCKQYENRIITIQNQHQRQIASLKQKLMKLNANQIIMQKEKQKEKLSLSSLNSLPQDLKPLSRKLRTNQNFN